MLSVQFPTHAPWCRGGAPFGVPYTTMPQFSAPASLIRLDAGLDLGLGSIVAMFYVVKEATWDSSFRQVRVLEAAHVLFIPYQLLMNMSGSWNHMGGQP